MSGAVLDVPTTGGWVAVKVNLAAVPPTQPPLPKTWHTRLLSIFAFSFHFSFHYFFSLFNHPAPPAKNMTYQRAFFQSALFLFTFHFFFSLFKTWHTSLLFHLTFFSFTFHPPSALCQKHDIPAFFQSKLFLVAQILKYQPQLASTHQQVFSRYFFAFFTLPCATDILEGNFLVFHQSHSNEPETQDLGLSIGVHGFHWVQVLALFWLFWRKKTLFSLFDKSQRN